MIFPRFFKSWSTQTIIDTAQHRHAQKRRVLAHALSESSLEQVENRVLNSISTFCKLLNEEKQQGSKGQQEPWSVAKDLREYTSYLSFDIMGLVCFGRSFDMLEKNENRYILNVISDGARCLNTVRIEFPIERLLQLKPSRSATCNPSLTPESTKYSSTISSKASKATKSSAEPNATRV